MAVTVKKDYKKGDRVRVISYTNMCCSSCTKAAKYFKKYKPIGTISYAGTICVDIQFDEPQDIHGDGDLISEWAVRYEYIRPAGPMPGEQLTFVFSGPCDKDDKKEEKPKPKKIKKKPTKMPLPMKEVWTTCYTDGTTTGTTTSTIDSW